MNVTLTIGPVGNDHRDAILARANQRGLAVRVDAGPLVSCYTVTGPILEIAGLRTDIVAMRTPPAPPPPAGIGQRIMRLLAA